LNFFFILLRGAMDVERSLVFPPFRLDLVNECLWCREERISLRGKTFAVLRCLLEHPGQLVTKEALFSAVWPDTCVGESALTICIRELRQALGDNPKTPQFIETVHRRGYRFIAPLSATQPVVSSQYPVVSSR
jgi:DNA-binding winged helix-turn-helix (wHTH) protein